SCCRDRSRSRERVEDQLTRAGELTEERVEDAVWLVVGVRSPARGFSVVVVAGGDAEGARRICRPRLGPLFAREDQRGFIDAEEDLVAAALAGALRPEVVGDLEEIPGLARRGADRTLVAESGPDGEGRRR